MIWRQVLAVDGLYVGLPDVAILGLVFSIALDEIGRWLIRWKSNA
jgi:ABC-type nitrate/sulfonate/bicarbonate transport system permease component